MNEKQPLVSIVTPAYNAEKYIKDSIKSVIEQTYNNWELIIIDDGSTDKTKEIVKNFNDLRITLFSQENKGVSSARNQGLKLVKGELITFLDADDILTTKSLEKRVKYFNTNQSINVLGGHVSIRSFDLKNELRNTPQGNITSQLIKLNTNTFFGIFYMFKQNILENIRFEDNMENAEDILFYIELGSASNIHYICIPDTIYHYRTGHTSASVNLDGLENGYLLLIKKISELEHVTSNRVILLRMKITRILFLSWLRKKKFTRAFLSFFYIFNFIKKSKIDNIKDNS